MTFAEIIPGLLAGNSYCYTKKDHDDESVHFFLTIAAPINRDNECLCIVYFDEIDYDDEIDPDPFELDKECLTINCWRQVTKDDYFVHTED